MKIINVAAIGAAGISAMVAVAARGQMETTASPNGPQAETVVDPSGNSRVPEAYRTTYQSLGSRAVAAGLGQTSKELTSSMHRPGPSSPIAGTDVSLTARYS